MNTTATGQTVFQQIRPSTLLMELSMLAGFNLLLVGSSYVSMDLPFSPVPVTGQTLGVLLIAMALGRVRAVGVTMAYLLEGTVGLPVFAGGAAGAGVLIGPTGGYLFGFLAATFVVGWLADRGWDRTILRSVVAMIVGTAIIFVFGLIQLAWYVPAEVLFESGLWPFVPGAIGKIILASIILPAIWRISGKSNPSA